MSDQNIININKNIDYWNERVDLAAAFRWTVKFDMHEAVANHFSLAVNDKGTQFLMNPDQCISVALKPQTFFLLMP